MIARALGCAIASVPFIYDGINLVGLTGVIAIFIARESLAANESVQKWMEWLTNMADNWG